MTDEDEEERVVAIDLSDSRSASSRNPSGAEPPELRDPGVFLRPMYLGKAAQESRVAINPKDNCKGGLAVGWRI